MNTTEIESAGVALATRCREIVVRDAPTYEEAAAILLTVKAYRARIAEMFDPIIEAAHKTHKEAIAQRKALDAPADEAERIVKFAMVAWQQTEQRRLAAEARAAEEEARRRAEDELLSEAAAAERAGDGEVAAAILDQPIVVPPAVVPRAAPRIAGISTRRQWGFRIADPTKLPRAFLEPNLHAIGAVVRAMREQTAIPGVEVFEESVMSVSPRN